MKVLIFEDEALTSERLIVLLKKYDPATEILAVLESVQDGILWFKKNTKPDLIFMDIHLADGSAFEIFAETQIDVPVIFTTAYDKYAIQAFKVNSVDYLLKPIDFDELKIAIDKYKNLSGSKEVGIETYKEILQHLTQPYKKRFLVKSGEQFRYINTSDVAYFIHDEGFVFGFTFEAKRFIVEHSLEELNNLLNPDDFFRINRKMIINLQSIAKIHTYFNSRLKLELKQDAQLEVIVSREKVSDFKKWLNR